MISDAYVRVLCNSCDAEEEVQLTALAGHGEYDMRNVRSEMSRLGWEIDDDERATCPECSEDTVPATPEGHDDA